MSADAKSVNRRASAAQDAIAARHLRPLLGCIPFTRIGVVSWPRVGHLLSPARITASWNLWWQAHLVDLLVDGYSHRQDDRSGIDAARVLRGIWLRNGFHWTNAYYDDMAWLGLAIERVDRIIPSELSPRHTAAAARLSTIMHDAWSPELGGGIPWRTTDTFFNAPANGPAAILLARTGRTERAVEMTDWIHRELLLPSGLIADGFWLRDGERQMVKVVYTYCQGVALGAEVEAYRITGHDRHLERVSALLRATEDRLTVDGVIAGAGGGDGGLFNGILARYLALVATDLPDAAGVDDLRARAAAIVTRSADAVWAHRAEDSDGRPVFGADWRTPTAVPTATGRQARKTAGAVSGSSIPERDLSVQISAGIALEAAVSVTIGSSEHGTSANPD